MALTDLLGRTVARLVLGAALLPAAALGQSAQQAIPNREQIEPPKVQTTPAPSQVRIDSNRAVPVENCPLQTSDVVVQINAVRFTGPGDAALPPPLVSLLAGIGAPAGSQPVRVVCDVRDSAAAALRSAGYVASVQIPPQRIEDGTLVLQVITAHITEVRIRGDAGAYEATLAARIEQLKGLNPLNERDAERILLVTGDIPGVDVVLTLRPAATAPGDVIGELTISTTRFAAIANVQNFGSTQLGRETGYVRVSAFGLTGASETYVAGSSTLDLREQQVIQVGHVAGLGDHGLTLGGSFIYAWSRPDIGVLDLRSKSLIASLQVEAPLVRSLRHNVSLAGGFELIEQRTRIFSNLGGTAFRTPLNRDKLRVAYLRLEGETRQSRLDGSDLLRLTARLELRRGLGILGSTRRGFVTAAGFTPSRFEGDPTATIVKGDVDLVVGLGPIFSLYAQARGQWANNPLLNFEEFSLGNLTIGRGYDPGANSADRAVALRGEARIKLHEVPGKARFDTYGFYDSVWIYNLDTNSTEDHRRLGSYGLGLRVVVPGRAQLDVLYARPTDRALLIPGLGRAADRLLVSLTYQFAQGAR